MIGDAYENVLKASRAFQLLKRDVDSASLGHAYLLVSPDAEAVKYLFRYVAMAIFCPNDMCGECAECQRILNDNNPDVVHVNLLGQAVNVDTVDSVLEGVYMRPLFSDKKVYMFYRADLMNARSQNKLLKTLEEPPKGVHFFLGTSNEAAVLDTIKSRTRKVYLEAFPKETLANAVAGVAKTPAQAEVAAVCADGMLSRALEIASSDTYFNLFGEALNMLKTVTRPADVVKILSSEAFTKSGVDAFLNILSVIFRDVMLISTNAELVSSRHVMSDLSELARHYPPCAAASAINSINKAREAAFFNVYGAPLAEKLFFDILEKRI